MVRNIIQRRLQSVLQKRPQGAGGAWRKRAIILGAVIFSTIVLGHLGVRFLLWPQIEKSKPAIEKLLSARLGANISIDALQVSWTGMRPSFQMTGLRFNTPDKTGTPLLQIQNIWGELSWESFYHLAPYFHDLHFQGAQIYAERNEKGSISVAGIPIDSNSDDFSAENWLLDQREIQVKDAQIAWHDAINTKPNTAIHVQQLYLNNGIRKHQAAITVSTPWSTDPIDIEANFVHRLNGQPGNWRDWIGRFSWNVSDLHLNQLATDFSLPINTLTGNLNSHGDLNIEKGLADGGQLYLAADQFRLQLNKGEEPVEFGHLETNLVQANDKGMLSVSTKHFAWRAIDAANNAPLQTLSPMTFRWRPPAPNEEIKEFGFSSSNIQVADAALFAINLPLPKKIHSWIKASEANGQLQDLDINWSESKSALATLPIPGAWFNSNKLDFAIKAKLIDLSMAGINKSMPTIRHLSGVVDADQNQGNFLLNSSNLEVEIHDFLEEPKIQLDNATGVISWSKQRGKWNVSAKQVAVKNADLTAKISVNYLLGNSKQPDQMTLDMDFLKAGLATAYRYLPVEMDKDTRQYLQSAFEAGDIEKGSLHIEGDPNEIPFSKPQSGEFSLQLPIINATFKPVPLIPSNQGIWGAFTKVNGMLSMQQSALTVDIPSAHYKTVALSNVHAQIPNVSANHLTASVTGTAQGDAPEMLEYLNASPFGKQYAAIGKNLRVTGPVNLNLALDVPLSGTDNPHIDAQLALSGNRAQWGSIPPFDNLKGKIRITEVRPEFDNVTANFLGGSLKITQAPSESGNTSFRIAGDINANFIKEYAKENIGSQYKPLLTAMSGTASYQGLLNFNKAGSETNLKFDLRNWGSAAPVPAKKSPGTPMLGQVILQTHSNAKPNRVDWSGKFGDSYFIQGALAADTGIRFALGIGAPATLPQQGFNLSLMSNELNLDTWRQFLNSGNNTAKATSNANPEATLSNAHINAQIKNLTAFNRTWTNFSLDATEKNDEWKARLNSPNLAGQASWHSPSTDNPSGLITAHLNRLKISEEIPVTDSTPTSKKAIQKSGTPKSTLQPNSIPSLDVIIDDFSWLKAQLGAVKIKTRTSNNIMQVDSIQVSNNQGNSTGSGQWSVNPKDGSQKSVVNLDMDIKNAGEIVGHWTNANSVEGGKGKLSGKVQWDGSPFSPRYETLSGTVDLYLEKGRLLEVNSDAAKLLNVLSLQSLFRFATLDLQGSLGNIVTKGTPFNSIASTFTITNGVANTKQFTMELDQARVAMNGQINIPNETQDLRVTVFPTLDATAGSIVAAFVVNPIVGLSALVGQYLITNQINRSMQSDYLIQGSWINPEVIPLDQKGQPLDPKTLETIRAKGLLKEQSKPSAPNAPSSQPSTMSTTTPA